MSFKALLLKMVLCLAFQDASLSNAAPAPCTSHFHLSGDQVQLVLEPIHGFPFLRATINGFGGRLMFDTGSKRALALNDHLLTQLGSGQKIGSSTVQSGQTFERILHPCLASIQLRGDSKKTDLADVESNSLAFMERLTPDFLGFLGYESFHDYAIKLDYGRDRLTFFHVGQKASLIDDALFGERVLAKIPFETRNLPNHPMFTGSIQGRVIVISLDTGQEGLLVMDDETHDDMMARGALQLVSSDSAPQRYQVNHLRLGGNLDIALEGLQIGSSSSEANKAVGIESQPSVTLGFLFFERFTTVWDFPHHVLYVLQIRK